jgi:hypothetical protein
MATEYRNNAKMSTSSLRRWCEHFPTPPSPPLPALQPPSRAADLLQLALISLSSRIKPLLEMRLEALEHLFFNVFDVGEPVPTSDIAVFTGTLKLQDEFFHQPPLIAVFFPEMLLANVRRLFLPVLGFLIPYCAPHFCSGFLPPPTMLENESSFIAIDASDDLSHSRNPSA